MMANEQSSESRDGETGPLRDGQNSEIFSLSCLSIIYFNKANLP